jgi:hypothetical protein
LPINFEQSEAQTGDTCLKDALEVFTLLDSLLNDDEKLDIERENIERDYLLDSLLIEDEDPDIEFLKEMLSD